MRVYGALFLCLLVAGFVWIPRVPAEQLEGHDRAVNAVAFSPDGKTLASTGEDGTVRIWDTASANQRLLFQANQRRVLALSFSPDGKTLASGADRDSVKIWDLSRGELRSTLDVPRLDWRMTTSLAFSPGGEKLAAAVARSYGPTPTRCELIVWDLSTKKQLISIRGGFATYPTLAFTPDGTKVALAGGEDAMLYDIPTGRQIASLLTASVPQRTGGVHSLAISPDGTTLASVEVWASHPPPSNKEQFFQIVLWDVSTGKQLAVLPRQTEKIACVTFGPDSQLLACGNGDGTVKLWNTSAGVQVVTLQGNTGAVYSVAISPDGKTLAAAGKSGTIKLWNLKNVVPGGGGLGTRTTIDCPASITYHDTAARATVTVTASDGSTPVGPVQLTFSNFGTFTHYLQNGHTQYTLSSLPVGTYTLTARYLGHGNWPASQSASQTLVVNPQGGGGGQIATTTTIYAPPITNGSNATVRVAVTSSNGVPTGSVNLSVSGGQPIPMALNSQGVAAYSLHPSGGPGDYTLDATYVPTGNFLASSAHGDLIVNPGGSGPIATSITISVPPTIQYQDHNARATVTVTAANGSTPSGTVGLVFSGFNGNQPFYHNLVNGSSQYTLDSLPPGMYTLTAAYAAQNGYAASQATAMLTVSTAASNLVNFVDFETGDFSQTASHVGGAIVTSPALDGHFSLQLLRNNGVANAEIRQSGTTYYNLPTAYYSFLFRLASQTGEGGVVNFQNTSSGYKAAIHLNAFGKLVFYDANGAALGIGTTVLNQNQTYTISAKIGTGAGGAWEVRINGNVEMSGNGYLGSGNNGSIKLGGGSPYTTNYYYDDVAIGAQGYP